MTLVLLAWIAVQFAPSGAGDLRVAVTDPGGLPVQSAIHLVSDANQVRQEHQTDARGVLVARRLPFGRYLVEVSSPGFAAYTGLVDLQSAVPTDLHVTLSLAPVQAQVTVSPDATLLDVHRISAVSQIGAETLRHRLTALPGRSLSDVVNTQPGWLLEANGILHPRGSEYQVQYVLDGLPITDNRSPAFAPAIDADGVHGMSILTAGYPAEYGRKLGGVVEVVTAGAAREGLHGSFAGSAGRFGTATGSADAQYGWPRTTLSASATAARTDRYLDPPVEENFTNRGSSSTVAVHVEREIAAADRAGAIVRHGEARFMVPNERVQQQAGQRQDRRSRETSAQFSYRRLFSPRVLGDVRGLARTLTADLSSNPLSTPIVAAQDRGFRETYVKATLSGHAGPHDWKAGGDAVFAAMREDFTYRISDPAAFDPETPLTFAFAGRQEGREQALFAQDRLRLGAWTLSAGVRWDRYRVVVDEQAVSPRLGAAWSWPAADLVVRAAYDRAFQTPAVENLLLASSPTVDRLGDDVVRLPVRPSLGNFYEAGLSKRLWRNVRLDLTRFVRRMTHFADDDVLLNTGVRFPMAFERADIRGTELKVEALRGRLVSGLVSYAHMRGVGFLPITGGLLLGDEPEEPGEFVISQDQRHTVRGRVNVELSSRASVALAAAYGSGLPVEFAGDRDDAVDQYGERIVDRVDLDRGRVRASFALDASASAVVVKAKRAILRIQADALNLTNRLNVINFAGLFSGTAIAPPRSVAIRAYVEY